MGSVVARSPFAMHIERDLKLAVPSRFRMPGLGRPGAVRVERPRRSTTTFYDTSDLALAAWGCMLRYRTGEGWTVKLPDRGMGDGLERPEQAFLGPPGKPPAAALALLVAFLRGRPVRAVAHLRTTRRRVSLGAGPATLVEVVDDRVSTTEPERRTFRQIEIELRDPSATDLRDEVVRTLVRAGAETGDRRTKYEWVLGERRPAPEVEAPRVGPRSPAGDAIRAALGGGVSALIRIDAQIRAGPDPEAVHQARVAVRRLRSDLRAFKTLLDPDWIRTLRNELGWLGASLGALRDRQVLAERIRRESAQLAEKDQISPVVDALDLEIAQARADLEATLGGERYVRLLERMVDAANAPRIAAGDGTATELLRPALDRAWKRLRRAAKRAREEPSGEELHPVRIEAKRVRYTCEALAPVFGKRASRLARAANELQDVLGEHQDAVVAGDWLRAHSDADGVVTAFTLGELAALQLLARDHARSRWPAAWKAVRRFRPAKWK